MLKNRQDRLSTYNGRTFVTNFYVGQRPIYEEAIRLFKEQFGGDGLYIKEEAFDSVGFSYKSMNSLHDRYKGRDLADFWNIFFN